MTVYAREGKGRAGVGNGSKCILHLVVMNVVRFFQFVIADYICSHLWTVVPLNADVMNCSFFRYSHPVTRYTLNCNRGQRLVNIDGQRWIAKDVDAGLSV